MYMYIYILFFNYIYICLMNNCGYCLMKFTKNWVVIGECMVVMRGNWDMMV